MTREEWRDAVYKCFERYKKLCEWEIGINEYLDLVYSLVNAERLLSFPDGAFMHDVVGISNNMNRKTLRLENCFEPRAGTLPEMADDYQRAIWAEAERGAII